MELGKCKHYDKTRLSSTNDRVFSDVSKCASFTLSNTIPLIVKEQCLTTSESNNLDYSSMPRNPFMKMLPTVVLMNYKIALLLQRTIPHVLECTRFARKLTWEAEGPTLSGGWRPEHAFRRDYSGTDLSIVQCPGIRRKLPCGGQKPKPIFT